jgi:GrpB-like predicted nucleotidyltransferase (UPF0157 family)
LALDLSLVVSPKSSNNSPVQQRVARSLEQRIEEAVREHISITEYDPGWPALFRSEADFLRAKIPASLLGRIEHFGSTAVRGLAAKPIVDMLIEVASLDDTKAVIVPILEASGYDYFWREDVSPPYAWFIKRNSEGERTHHLHMVERDSELWDRLFFRDYLQDFPEEAERYVVLKRELAANYPNDRIAYTEGKAEYIRSVTAKAKHFYQASQL